MSQKIKEELEKVAYGDLLKKFKELGVESAWTPGTKKAEMIQLAIEKIAIINKMKEAGIDQEAIDSQIELAEQEKKEKELKEKAEKKRLEEEAELKVQKEIEDKKMDLPTLHKVLKNIDANLKGGVATHRNILIQKRKTIMDLIAKEEE